MRLRRVHFCKLWKPTLRIILSAAFFIQAIQFSNLAYAKEELTQDNSLTDRQTDIFLLGYYPPSHLAKVTDSYLSSSFSVHHSSFPLVINIQDLHTHYGVQKKISELLEFYAKKGISTKFVAMEGAQGLIDNTLLAFFPDEEIKKKVLDRYMQKGLLTGMEDFSARVSNPDLLWGVDDQSLYNSHYNFFKDTLSDRSRLSEKLQDLNNQLKALEPSIYSVKMRKIHQKKNDYEQGKISLKDYLANLTKLAKRSNIAVPKEVERMKDLLVMEKSLNPSSLNHQTKESLAILQVKLSKEETEKLANYAKTDNTAYYLYLHILAKRHHALEACPEALKNYFQYTSSLQSIDMAVFQNQLDDLAHKVLLSCATTIAQKNLAQAQHYVTLLNDLVELKLTGHTLAQVLSRAEPLVKLLETLLVGAGMSNFSAKDLKELVAESVDFYAMALMRDEPMVEQTLQRLNNVERGLAPLPHLSSRSVPDPGSVTILVTGGFHSSGIASLLKEKGISYLVVSPMVESYSELDQERYINRLLDRSKEKIVPKDTLALARDLFSRARSFFKPMAADYVTEDLRVRYGQAEGSEEERRDLAVRSLNRALAEKNASRPPDPNRVRLEGLVREGGNVGLNLGGNLFPDAIDELIPEEEIFAAPAMRWSGKGLTKEQHDVVNEAIASYFQPANSLDQRLLDVDSREYKSLDPDRDLRSRGVRIYVFKGFIQKITELALQRGVDPPADLVTHPGRTRGNLYLDETTLPILMSRTRVWRRTWAEHELAHIRNPKLDEEAVQTIAPLPKIEKVTEAVSIISPAPKDPGVLEEKGEPLTAEESINLKLAGLEISAPHSVVLSNKKTRERLEHVIQKLIDLQIQHGRPEQPRGSKIPPKGLSKERLKASILELDIDFYTEARTSDGNSILILDDTKIPKVTIKKIAQSMNDLAGETRGEVKAIKFEWPENHWTIVTFLSYLKEDLPSDSADLFKTEGELSFAVVDSLATGEQGRVIKKTILDDDSMGRYEASEDGPAMRWSGQGLTKQQHDIVNEAIAQYFTLNMISQRSTLDPNGKPYQTLDPAGKLKANGITIHLFPGLMDRIIALASDKRVEPPADLVVHPGRRSKSLYLDSTMFFTLLYQPSKWLEQWSDHELAHINYPEKNEEEAQSIAPLPAVEPDSISQSATDANFFKFLLEQIELGLDTYDLDQALYALNRLNKDLTVAKAKKSLSDPLLVSYLTISQFYQASLGLLRGMEDGDWYGEANRNFLVIRAMSRTLPEVPGVLDEHLQRLYEKLSGAFSREYREATSRGDERLISFVANSLILARRTLEPVGFDLDKASDSLKKLDELKQKVKLTESEERGFARSSAKLAAIHGAVQGAMGEALRQWGPGKGSLVELLNWLAKYGYLAVVISVSVVLIFLAKGYWGLPAAHSEIELAGFFPTLSLLGMFSASTAPPADPKLLRNVSSAAVEALMPQLDGQPPSGIIGPSEKFRLDPRQRETQLRRALRTAREMGIKA